LLSRAAKLLRLSGREKMLFLEALVLHLWVGLVLKMVPFRWIPRLFRNPQPAVDSRRSAVCGDGTGEVPHTKCQDGSQSQDIFMVKRAIERANVISPWTNRCLVSSLAARRMLGRRGIESQLSLGVAQGSEGKVLSHAWLISDDFEIVKMGGDFTVMYTF